MTSSEIENQARELRQQHLRGVVKPPVPVQDLAETLGIKVVSTPLESGVSGALIKDGENWFIVVNSNHHTNRQRFTIAHEIAHFHLEHAREEHVDREFTVLMRDENSAMATDPKEIEANRFAAELLMPEEMIIGDFVKIGRIDDEIVSRLALKYQVSKLAFEHRLRNIGLLQPC